MTKPRRAHVTGPLAAYAVGFQKALAGQGYRSGSVRNQLLRMAQLSSWLGSREMSANELTANTIDEFLAARRDSGYSTYLSPIGLSQLLGYLRSVGATSVPAPPTPSAPVEVLMQRYTDYLAQERGLTPASVIDYVRAAKGFFTSRPDSGKRDFDRDRLSSAEVTEYVLLECQRETNAHARRTVSRLRSLLRFLFVERLTETALAEAVPSVANWAGSLPKAIGASDVIRLLRSCDGQTAAGRRDFAILTVLARLGLRAGEVAMLRLRDIEWRAGEMVVRGKGGRIARLPLPVDVGEAIVGWLGEGRPRCESPYVFTRIRAPLDALSVAGVSTVVTRACQRAGLPPVHAHRLRHTAATEMLRAGGSLMEVGQVMRHANQLTTSIYAKVDGRALSAVVQPWPGSAV